MVANKSAKRTIEILEYLADADKPKPLAVISRDLGIHKSTLYRFLSTLMDEGYVQQERESGRYYVSLKLAWLSAKLLDRQDIRTRAKPLLEELALVTGETVHLGVVDGYEVVYIDKVAGNQAVQMRSRIGHRSPLHSSALGKVLLSNMPTSKWQEYIDNVGLRPYTPNTITDAEIFMNHLRKVQEQGFSIDNVENEEGIRCVASPIRNHVGEVVAAVSVSGSILTMTKEKVENVCPLLFDETLRFSKSLGYKLE
jgi:IclR family KDG regulon transcriptional repressor